MRLQPWIARCIGHVANLGLRSTDELARCHGAPAIRPVATSFGSIGVSTKHRADLPCADRHQEFFKANARNTRSRMTLIIVDHCYFLPSDLTRAISESILA